MLCACVCVKEGGGGGVSLSLLDWVKINLHKSRSIDAINKEKKNKKTTTK